MSKLKLRCAVYTRKSTEDGLEQDFNSLDAQREACAAYVKSQAHEGWLLLDQHYDDGAYSGATLERPAMQRLLSDVRTGHVDVIVVYKVDRLTRSLMDFAKLVDVFDKYNVSFVSITQQFNTTSSLGRLTLNVLLSFAQFEREVTAERIRDKIAASRKKGLWMGGTVPLGYDLEDKTLIPNKREAERVRAIYELYLSVGNIRSLLRELHIKGIKPKATETFSRGALHHLLTNPVYIGKARHKGQLYKGVHEAILEKDLFDKVQKKLTKQIGKNKQMRAEKGAFLLRGLLFDDDGVPMTTSHSTKNGKRYFYYMSQERDPMKELAPTRKGWRLPTKELEGAIIKAIKQLLSDPDILMDALNIIDANSDIWARIGAARYLIESDIRLEIIPTSITRIDLSQSDIKITCDRSNLAKALNIDANDPSTTDPTYIHIVPVQLRRRGVENKLILEGPNPTLAQEDQKLITLVAKAHQWFDDLKEGRVESIKAIAAQECISATDVSRYLTLAFIDPKLVKDIVHGRQPITMTSNYVKRRLPFPEMWREKKPDLGTNEHFSTT